MQQALPWAGAALSVGLGPDPSPLPPFDALLHAAADARDDAAIPASEPAGAERRGVGAVPERSPHRGEVCSACGLGLWRIPGKRRWNEGKRVCQRCYNRMHYKRPREATPPPIPATIPAPSVRRPTISPIQLTPERVSDLHSTIKAAGIGQRGRTRTPVENARAILHVHALTPPTPSTPVRALSFDSAVKHVAAVEMMSPHLLRETMNRFAQRGPKELSPVKKPRITRADPQHPLYGEGRTWQETAQQTKDALSAVTPELTKSIVEHTEKAMNEWLTTSEAGSLRAHGSLAALGCLTPEQRALCTDLGLAETLMVGDAEEDKENQAPSDDDEE